MNVCSNCGTDLPAEARFCFLCGAPVAAPAPSRNGPPEDARSTCRIRLWRGYVKSEFYVEFFDPDADGFREDRSRSFRWRKDAPPPSERDDVRRAYDELVERLKERGWEQVGLLTPWYAQRFRRHEGGLQVVAEPAAKRRRRTGTGTAKESS